MPEECPRCGERTVVPILANKYKCKSCEEFLDLVELIRHKRGEGK